MKAQKWFYQNLKPSSYTTITLRTPMSLSPLGQKCELSPSPKQRRCEIILLWVWPEDLNALSMLYCKDHLLGKLFSQFKVILNFCSLPWTLLHFSDVCIWSEQFVWAVRGEWRLLWCWLSQQGYRHRTSKPTSSKNEEKGKSGWR